MQKSDIRSIYASFLAIVHLIYRFYHTTYPIDFTRLYTVDRDMRPAASKQEGDIEATSDKKFR